MPVLPNAQQKRFGFNFHEWVDAGMPMNGVAIVVAPEAGKTVFETVMDAARVADETHKWRLAVIKRSES